MYIYIYVYIYIYIYIYIYVYSCFCCLLFTFRVAWCWRLVRLCKPGGVFLCLAFGPFSITAAPMQTAEDSVNWLFMKRSRCLCLGCAFESPYLKNVPVGGGWHEASIYIFIYIYIYTYICHIYICESSWGLWPNLWQYDLGKIGRSIYRSKIFTCMYVTYIYIYTSLQGPILAQVPGGPGLRRAASVVRGGSRGESMVQGRA